MTQRPADVKLTRVEARMVLRMPPEERKAAVDKLIEDGELPRTKKVAADRRPKEIAESFLARLQKKGEAHARSVVRQLARLLGLELAEKEAEERGHFGAGAAWAPFHRTAAPSRTPTNHPGCPPP